jgi:hypothetical protein
VSNVDELDSVATDPECLDESVDAVTRQSEHNANAPIDEAFDEKVCDLEFLSVLLHVRRSVRQKPSHCLGHGIDRAARPLSQRVFGGCLVARMSQLRR